MKQIMLGLCLFLVALASARAHSATLVFSGEELVGARGVDVNGSVYDVSFLDGSCNSLFSDCSTFTFSSLDTANAASNALIDQVLQDVNPISIRGIEEISFIGIAFLTTPFEYDGLNDSVSASLVSMSPSSSAFVIAATGKFVSAGVDTTNDLSANYVLWSPTNVPLPAALWLFMFSIAGLGVSKRYFS